MAFLTINSVDFSPYTQSLKINNNVNYTAKTNAKGNTVVDKINSKIILDVGIIALNDSVLRTLLTQINSFSVIVSYRDPETGSTANNISCIIPSSSVEYYTIQQNKTQYKQFNFQIQQL